MKSIPAALQAHLDGDATTTCFLLKVECVGAFAGTVLGSTTLDETVIYDDGAGSLTYSANNSFSVDRLQTTGDLSVDNTELHGWVGDQVTEAQIRAGIFSFANVTIYRVNYLDLTTGRHEYWAGGKFGRVIYTRNRWQTEYRSLVQLLKEPKSDLYTKVCPVQFGSPQCGKTFIWATYTVTAVDVIEPDRIFIASAMTEADDYYTQGVVEFLSGNNQGSQMEVRTHASDTVSMALGLSYPVVIGDQFRIRKDCSKFWDDANNGCLFHWGADRWAHFRGQPDIPTADGGASMIPGAQI
ncbi:MAG TPA: DUF2163 domain-containing protein [Anaerolineales bacterium]|nr:DUF2163 domain-containing protein [Anaerolineales bacterium]